MHLTADTMTAATSEDGCAVDEAFQKCMIDEGRMQRYREFYKELYDNRNNYKRRKRK